MVFGDAFNDYSVPFHLTTLEVDRMVERSLREGGLYLANNIDGGPNGHFFRAYVSTIQQAFPYVAVIPSMSEWRQADRTTFVVVASQQPLHLESLPSRYQPLSESELQEYMALEPYRILADDHVPVDNLMAPVVEDSFSFSYLTPEMMDQIMVRLVAVGAVLVVALLGVIIWRVRRRWARAVPH